jgi:hypothetical protein
MGPDETHNLTGSHSRISSHFNFKIQIIRGNQEVMMNKFSLSMRRVMSRAPLWITSLMVASKITRMPQMLPHLCLILKVAKACYLWISRINLMLLTICSSSNNCSKYPFRSRPSWRSRRASAAHSSLAANSTNLSNPTFISSSQCSSSRPRGYHRPRPLTQVGAETAHSLLDVGALSAAMPKSISKWTPWEISRKVVVRGEVRTQLNRIYKKWSLPWPWTEWIRISRVISG